MELEYDKAVLQKYMNQIENVGRQMQLRQDESFNLFTSCKQQYSRIHTKLEEASYNAYNQVENAESMQRNAELEYETARRITENDEDEDNQNAAIQRMQSAQAMKNEADEEYDRASAAYSKASDDLRRLSELWDGNINGLELRAHSIENGMVTFLRLAEDGNSDLSEYMNVMDNAQAALYGMSGNNTGPAGSTVNSAAAQVSVAGDGQMGAGPLFKSKLGNAVGIVNTADGLKAVSMKIGGRIQTFPNTKSGIAKAYRMAQKSGDSELISYTKRMFFNFDKNQIAALMVDNGLVMRADFGKLDTKTAQDIYISVSDTLEMFPEIDLHFAGSLQSRNENIEKHYEKMYLRIYRQNFPAASDAELMPLVRQQVSEVMKEFEPDERTIAESVFIETPQIYGEGVIEGFHSISVNERYGSDYEYFINTKKDEVKTKHKPVGCDTPRATVDHELGHQIAILTNAHNDAIIKGMYSDFMKLTNTQRCEALSGYAGESIHEFIAEGWSEYRNNPNCRPLAKNIANRLFDLYNQAAG